MHRVHVIRLYIDARLETCIGVKSGPDISLRIFVNFLLQKLQIILNKLLFIDSLSISHTAL